MGSGGVRVSSHVEGGVPEWILEDEPKIVNGLLVRLFRGIKVMADKKIVPVLRN